MSAPRLERPSPLPAPAPCASSPERWMDRRDRAHALATYLQCPVRRWCAQEALRVQASWGMWAGVWIDGHLSPVAPLLRSVATPAALPHVTSVAALPAGHVPVERRPLPRRRAPRRPGSPHTAVLVRSSGHCEVMRAGCGLRPRSRQSRFRCPRRALGRRDLRRMSGLHGDGHRLGQPGRSRAPRVLPPDGRPSRVGPVLLALLALGAVRRRWPTARRRGTAAVAARLVIMAGCRFTAVKQQID
jgi:hypothetical protein